MKLLNMYQTTTIALVLLFTTFSCSNDDGPTPGCFQEDNRRIIEIVTDFSATIRGPETHQCPRDYIIEPDERLPNNILRVLSPCNLEEDLQTDALRVRVSGFIYESFEDEDICADFFEITEISIDP